MWTPVLHQHTLHAQIIPTIGPAMITIIPTIKFYSELYIWACITAHENDIVNFLLLNHLLILSFNILKVMHIFRNILNHII